MQNQKDRKTEVEDPVVKEYEKLSQMYDDYISNKKLYIKYASLLGIQRVMYVKGKDLKQFFAQNFESIKNQIKSISNVDIGKEPTEATLQKFYQFNNQRNIMHYLQRVPGDKAKYPKRLLPLKKTDDPNKDLVFNESGFYLISIKIEKSNKPIIYLGILVTLVLLIVIFPIWPLSVKIGVWWILFGLLIFLILFLILTIVVVLIGLLFGYDIYILPNLDEYKMTWKDRFFNPFVAYESREDPLYFKIIRVIFGVSLVLLSLIAFIYPDIPKEAFYMFGNWISTFFNYVKTKIVVMHNNRNAVKVSEKQFFDDLNNL